MKKVLKRVDQLLTKSPGLVNSDKKLQLNVWSGEGLRLTREQRAIFLLDCTPAASIDRARRHLQPKYIAFLSDKVAIERHLRSKKVAAQLSKRLTLQEKPLKFELTPRFRITSTKRGMRLWRKGSA